MGKLANGRTEREWRPLWTNDLWSSANYINAPIPEKGYYLILWSRCRDGKYAGWMCFATGLPMTSKEIINLMLPQERDRTDRIKNGLLYLLRTGLLYLFNTKTSENVPPDHQINHDWIHSEISENQLRNYVLVVRKYTEKTAQMNMVEEGRFHQQMNGRPGPDVGADGKQMTSREQPEKNDPLTIQGLMTDKSSYKSKESKSKDKDICLSLFAYWNSLPNVLTHRMLTDRIKRAISGRLGDGYTAEELKTMMSNYSEILTGGLLKQYFWTYRWGLTDFLARHKDRFNDIVIARQTFANREQYQDNRVQCSECFGKGKYILQGTMQRCHKCKGKGYGPDVSKMPKEK